MSLRGGCHTWPNYTIHFYAGLQHMEDSSVSLSPIMLASVVIGFIITISCFFIILVSVYPKKPWDPPRRHRHYWGDPQDGQGELLPFSGPALASNCDCNPGRIEEAAALPWGQGWGPHREGILRSWVIGKSSQMLTMMSSKARGAWLSTRGVAIPQPCPLSVQAVLTAGPDDSQERPRCRGGVHCTCGLRGDRLAPSGCSHQDAPPSYEECTGPGATQLYLPTEAPPPYWPTDSDSDLHTVSVDALPPYEAVWAPCPPPSWLPLPGPEPEPSSPQGPPTPKGSRACSPEMIV
ncbi:protein BEAN1 [Pipistrellus kuhlii]|uniref:protein BEAN1 n=1 Tax=Pipistrellus kuhlii TaxID=59472 RepID=UPI001E2726EC|nr:protein BEAN1 [Pipistrellus kuhlii]